MKFFGFKFAGDDTLHAIEEKQYSRFEAGQHLAPTDAQPRHVRVKPKRVTPNRVAEVAPVAAPRVVDATPVTPIQPAADHLHSDGSISPSILRKALPIRFQEMDRERYNLMPDGFDFARASA